MLMLHSTVCLFKIVVQYLHFLFCFHFDLLLQRLLVAGETLGGILNQHEAIDQAEYAQNLPYLSIFHTIVRINSLFRSLGEYLLTMYKTAMT